MSSISAGNSNYSAERKFSLKSVLGKVMVYILLILGGIAMAVPFLWMLSTSLKDEGSVFSIPPQWIPSPVVWENYKLLFEKVNMVQGFTNTMMIIIPTIAIGLFVSALAGYGFAKQTFLGRDKLFTVLLGTIMIPGTVTMIPAFIMFKNFGWVDSWKPLMIPGMFGAPMVIFFLRQFFMTIPNELEEAARIDGMNPFGIFMKIMVPLAKPAIMTQAVLSFNGSYNDYLGPLIYLNSPEKWTLQLELASLSSYYSSEWTYIMAGSVLALLPTLLLFAFLQRYFIEGIALTGIKG
ncbi:sugar ABC transporter ATP-binding protein [Paenibacillus stellifer]|uniref:Sugar ABC transporter ATP-binding protein n=1 Tax=Paenibacillus stellifer TaxID=169760 RepID=A0A089N2Z9_9BACL|nr:carbohydrate ABC transporter permease [Paenibacillus stellifer]AIQ63104.1 sugar ABC transporter ATP-binding protein [Paenibacillus stellifer]